jgi:hypothetical protein
MRCRPIHLFPLLVLFASVILCRSHAAEPVFATFLGDSTREGEGRAGSHEFTWFVKESQLAAAPGTEGSEKLAYNKLTGPITMQFDPADTLPVISRINFTGLASPTSRFEVSFRDADGVPLDSSHGRPIVDETVDDLWVYDKDAGAWYFDGSLTQDALSTTILDFRAGMRDVGQIVVTPLGEEGNAMIYLKVFP